VTVRAAKFALYPSMMATATTATTATLFSSAMIMMGAKRRGLLACAQVTNILNESVGTRDRLAPLSSASA